jgi:hypothetical protein
MSGAETVEKSKRSLVQLYTGLIYRSPQQSTWECASALEGVKEHPVGQHGTLSRGQVQPKNESS